mmetsp:Transcript_23789/g.56007  ORF Transcript_23789/g.56007 Transcript_23789/m.56007 type:complete len:212 (-) Transcript_23789:1569-2204(-)
MDGVGIVVLVVVNIVLVLVSVGAPGAVLAHNRRGLGNRGVDPRQQDPVPGGGQGDLGSTPPPRNRDRFDGRHGRVLVVLVRDKSLSQHPDLLARPTGSAVDPGQGIKGPSVAAAVELGDVHDEFFGRAGFAAQHVPDKGCVQGSRIAPGDLSLGGRGRGWHVFYHHVDKTARGRFQEPGQGDAQQRPGGRPQLGLGEVDPQRLERRLHVFF